MVLTFYCMQFYLQTTVRRKERVRIFFRSSHSSSPPMERCFHSNRLTSIDLSRTRNPPLDRTIKVTSVFDSRNSNYLESRSSERAFSPISRERRSPSHGVLQSSVVNFVYFEWSALLVWMAFAVYIYNSRLTAHLSLIVLIPLLLNSCVDSIESLYAHASKKMIYRFTRFSREIHGDSYWKLNRKIGRELLISILSHYFLSPLRFKLRQDFSRKSPFNALFDAIIIPIDLSSVINTTNRFRGGG